MLTFFPKPYPDELVYSVLARYHIRSGNRNASQTANDLFHTAHAMAVYDLPTHLERVASNIPPYFHITAENLLWNHTMYPLYVPFMPKQRAQVLGDTMRVYQEGVQGVQALIGNNGRMVLLPTHFRYCPSCMEEDEERYGETYWRRLHQAPGVFLCPKHERVLCESGVAVRGEYDSFYKAATREGCQGEEQVIPLHAKDHLIHIAKEVEWILENHPPAQEDGWYEERYLTLLGERKYCKQDGKVDILLLMQRMRAFYGDDFLSFMESPLTYDPIQTQGWLERILRKSRLQHHPVRHILLLHFLGCSFEELLEMTPHKEYLRPFGEGPWPCLNPAADHYRQDVIKEISVRQGKGQLKTIGTFSCTCGFSYTRNGPDVAEENRYHYHRVLSYGEVWEDALREFVQTCSKEETAKRLGVCSHTVTKKIKELGIKREGKTEQTKPLFGEKINLAAYDKVLLKEVKEAVQALEESEDHPLQITKSRIANMLEKGWLLHKKLEQLPQTASYLEQVIETKEAYEVRCIKWAAWYLHKNGERVKKTRVRQLSKCRTYTEEIRQLIADEVEHYTNLEL